MPCYIIQAGNTDKVKIGWASDPEQRLRDLQTAHYEELRIIRTIAGPSSLEGRLHRYFADFRVRGEWFRLSTLLLKIEPRDLPPTSADDVAERDLLVKIESFLSECPMTATKFGRAAVGDPTFVHELRKGRECRRSIRQRVLAFIELPAAVAAEIAE